MSRHPGSSRSNSPRSNSPGSNSPHFKNHLLFYVVAIATVLSLFQLTSAYGEANLEAPPNLNGRYLSATAPPGCPSDRQFVLTIQQSGIYLNGAIELVQAAQAGQAPPAPLQPEQLRLIGHWRQQQLNLSGPSPALATCASPASPALPASPIDIQATFQPPPSPSTGNHTAAAAITGQINFGSAQPWDFTAVRQAAPTQQQQAH